MDKILSLLFVVSALGLALFVINIIWLSATLPTCEINFYDGELAVCKNGDVVERSDSFKYESDFKEV